MNYDGSWHGGKGSRARKIDKDAFDLHYSTAFGRKLTWLDKKRLKELWLLC